MDSVKVYDINCAIENIEHCGTGVRINCVECFESRLFIGTVEGILLEYFITDERTDLKYQYVRQVNLNKSSKQINQIRFTRTTSVINLLIILHGSTLFLLDIHSLEKKLNSINNVSCISVDENSGCDPFSLEICISKKNSLLLLLLNDKGFTTLRDINVDSTPLGISIEAGLVCCALSSGKYQMIKIKMKKETQELCDFEPKDVTPLVTHFAKEEFLVIGPGGLGIFVTSKGTSERPPIIWPASINSITVDGINVISIGEGFLYIHSVIDYSNCNVERFPGAKNACISEGRLFVWTFTRLFRLRAVSTKQQIQSLLESEEVEKAFQLIKLAHLKAEEKAPLLKKVHEAATFKFITECQFDLARESLFESSTDIREVIKLLPTILPVNSKFISTMRHNFGTFQEVFGDDEEKMFKLVFFIVDILLMDPHKTYSNKDLATSLLKLSSKIDLSSFEEIVAKIAIMDVDREDVIEWLEGNNSKKPLAYFYKASGQLDKSLDIWLELIEENEAVQIIVDNLVECRNVGLVDTYFQKLFKINQGKALEIYIRKEDRDLFNPLKIAESLHNWPQLCIEYIEDCIGRKGVEDPELHTYLATIYIDQIINKKDPFEEESLRNKLRKFLIVSNSLKVNFLIGRLNGTSLRHELALLHGKAGNHQPALNVLTKELNDHKLAREYCLGISNVEERKKAFIELIRIYVNSNEKEDSSNCIALLKEFCQEFDLVSVLPILPDEWSLEDFKNLLTSAVRSCVHKKRETKIKKSLLIRLNIDLVVKNYEENQGFSIENGDMNCDNCKNKLALEDGILLKNDRFLLHRECS